MNIFVTGGTSGIGRKIVEDLANDHDVVFTGRSEEKANAVKYATGSNFILGDLTNSQDSSQIVSEYFTKYGNCDVLINNAGLWTEGKIEEANSNEIEKVFDINTIAPILLTKEFVSKIKENISSQKQSSARIIFMNSIAGLNPKAERSVYNASKWAITGFARSLSLELGPFNIGVTNLCPGYVDTELFDNGGYPREAVGAMDPAIVAKAVRYVVELGPEVSINELAIKPTLYS